MLFQTWDFVIFFAVVLGGLALLRPGLRAWWLLAASWFFYGNFNPVFLIFLVYISLFDYWIGRGVAAAKTPFPRKLLVFFSVINGVALLGLFKYAGFITENLQALCDRFDLGYKVPTLAESAGRVLDAMGLNYELTAAMLLPVGLSYFTFKSLSYTIDVYRGTVRCERSFIRYACYLAFFPTVLMGPIDRSGLFLRQLRHRIVVRKQDVADGVSLFISGLFKKVVLADTLAVFVEKVYKSDVGDYNALTVLFATYAFAWQLYGDFSGYSEMASGIARLMGFRITLNFNCPYVAVNFTDFWRRWHISLSTWFRDYVYIPLGGNRAAEWRIWLNLFITMVVSGFWHGEAWAFLIWGAWHGVLCVVWRFFDKAAWYLAIPKLIRQIAVFNLAAFGWIFFCSKALDKAWGFVKILFSWSGEGISLVPWYMFALVAAVWGYQLVYDSKFRRYLEFAPVRYLLMALVILLIMAVPGDANQKFLYFDF